MFLIDSPAPSRWNFIDSSSAPAASRRNFFDSLFNSIVAPSGSLAKIIAWICELAAQYRSNASLAVW
jgi:hypothetical protein